MPLLVVYNPVSGSGSAKSLVEEHILPVLKDHNAIIDGIIATEYAGHAGIYVAEYLQEHSTALTVVLASGDGTLHEIIDRVLPRSPPNIQHAFSTRPCVSFVLVPTGTANALYSSLFPPVVPEVISTVGYKLQSLHLYLNGKNSVPLTHCVTSFIPRPISQATPGRTPSCVVTSTSLHASILYDSEALRREVPGLERFKLAAQKNSKRWYSASAKLLPSSSGAVQVWDPASNSFVNHPESTAGNLIVEIKGPFIYFLSTVNVDRLEPEFRITPLARMLSSSGATCDLVIVRPRRDPSINEDNEEARERYVDKIWRVMGDAYKGGLHINLRYDNNGQITNDGDGPLVVEYVRCGGWEWIPDDGDERAHLVCADGDIFIIEDGGRAVSLATTPSDDAAFTVYG